MSGVEHLFDAQVLPGFLQSAPPSELFALVRIATSPAIRTIWSDCKYVVDGWDNLKRLRCEKDWLVNQIRNQVRTSWPRLCQRRPHITPSSRAHHDLWRRLTD